MLTHLCIVWSHFHTTVAELNIRDQDCRPAERKIFAIWPFAEGFADRCSAAQIRPLPPLPVCPLDNLNVMWNCLASWVDFLLSYLYFLRWRERRAEGWNWEVIFLEIECFLWPAPGPILSGPHPSLPEKQCFQKVMGKSDMRGGCYWSRCPRSPISKDWPSWKCSVCPCLGYACPC